MRVSRFFVAPQDIDQVTGRATVTDPKVIHQIVTVLRLRTGQRLDILDGDGSIFRCQLEGVGGRGRLPRQLTLTIVERAAALGEAAVDLVVALPVLRSSRFEWALEKLSELGAKTIVPIRVQRSVGTAPSPCASQAMAHATGSPPSASVADALLCSEVHLPFPSTPESILLSPARDQEHQHLSMDEGSSHDSEGAPSKLKRWQVIAREAAEQSERGMIPNVVKPMPFSDFIALSQMENDDRRLIALERSNSVSIKDALCNQVEALKSEAAGKIWLVVGAEGGFTEEEIALSLANGFTPVSLGKRILRSETAAIYSASVIMSLLDE